MRLLGVELTRLRWRRAVLVLVVAAVAIPAFILGAVAWDTRPVSAAEVAAAEEQAAAERDQPYIQDELERCLEDPEQYGGSVDSDDPQVQCEEMILPRAEWFLFRQPLDVEQQLQDTGSAVPVLLFVLLLLVGATFVGADWTSGSMSNQLLFEPRRIRVWAAKAGALALLAAATPASAAVSAAGKGDATFVNYTAPGDLARRAGEPTIGVNWKTGKVLFQAFTETDQVSFDDSKLPAVATWKDVSRPPTNITSLDPILETDPITGRTLVSQLAPPCSIAAFTDSDGEPTATAPTGFTPAAACGVGSNFDHQTVHFGKSVTPNPMYGPDRVAWYCSQVVVQSTCSVSRNGGLVFESSNVVYTFKGDLLTDDQTIVGCEGLHGHLGTSPVDGTAYLPNFACNSPEALDVDRPSVVVSPDEGQTWTIRQVPDGTSPNFDSDPAVDVDEGDRAYVAYENATSNLMVATTEDRGATFTPSVDLGAPYGIKNATMPTVQAGSDGRAVVAFFGTTAEAPTTTVDGKPVPENQLLSFDPDGNDPKAGWHLYVAMTYDGGASWTTSDVTPNDPVQRGCIWWGSAMGEQPEAEECQNNKRNLLDFIDVAVDKQGRVVVGWADGCVAACVTQGHTRNSNLAFEERPASDAGLSEQQFDELYSQEDIGVITRQSCGLGLYAAFDTSAQGPSATCSRLSGAAPVAAPVAAPGAAPGGAPAAPSAGSPGTPSRPVASGGSLPTTGGAPLLAVAGLLLLGVAAAARRRAPLG